jgi:hypothetical protein
VKFFFWQLGNSSCRVDFHAKRARSIMIVDKRQSFLSHGGLSLRHAGDCAPYNAYKISLTDFINYPGSAFCTMFDHFSGHQVK